MLVKLTEVCGTGAVTSGRKYSLREVFVNPEHVVMIREEMRMKSLHESGHLPNNLDAAHRFTKLTINRGHTGTEIVVVGAPDIIEQTLNNNKQLLRG